MGKPNTHAPAGKLAEARNIGAAKKAACKEAQAKAHKGQAQSKAVVASGDLDDLDAIFKRMKKGKASPQDDQTTGNTAASPASSSTRVDAHGDPLAAVVPRPPRPVRDGLYHAPEKTMGMSDDDFFGGGNGGGMGGGKRKKLGTVSEAEAQLLKQEGVDRIVSMRELQGMLSRNPRAGMTPDCPFGCDCCF